MTDNGINEESVLRKVQALIDKAMSTEFPAERDSLLAKADEMMIKYSIDQAALLDPSRANTAGAVRRTIPEVRTINYMHMEDHDVQELVAQIFWSVAEHNRARIGYYGWQYSKVVGYPADLDFLEMMFLSIQLDIASNLNPRVNIKMPWVESLASFKRAGFTWQQMHTELLIHPQYPYRDQYEWSRNIGVAFTTYYRNWSLQHPEQARNKTNPKLWRRSFIEGYQVEICRRLRQMRAETIKAGSTNLPALLNDMKSEVEEFYYQMFPEKRPHVYTPEEIEARRQANANLKPVKYRAYKEPARDRTAFGAGMATAANADLSSSSSRINNRKEALG